MSTIKPLGTLREIDLRSVWKDEARDFTPWLLKNVQELAAALNLDLELQRAEHPVGKFSLDILGVIAGTSDRVVIENQLGVSDHSHFGQLLTYAGGTDAKYVIWIASKFRPEYVAAINWLNNGTTEDISFFAVEVKAVQIGTSLAAPLFNVVAEPNEWSKEARARATSAMTGERGLLQIEFWNQFLESVSKSHPAWTSSRKGRAQSWLAMSAKLSGASFCVAFTNNAIKSELIFDSQDMYLNASRFEFLQSHKAEIEEGFGAPLTWHFPEGNKHSLIRHSEAANFMDSESWGQAIGHLIESLSRLRSSVEPFVSYLRENNL